MDAAAGLREARERAGLTQRELSARSGTPQPTIARIERRVQVPRADTLDRLLRACGCRLEVRPVVDEIDRTLIRALLDLAPAQRLERLRVEHRNLQAFPQGALVS